MTDDVWERLRLIHQVTGELAELARLGEAAALRPGPAQRAMERETEVIGEACRQIEKASREDVRELEERLLDVDWSGWRGLRNIVVHDPLEVNHRILWGAVESDGPMLRTALERTFGPGIAGRPTEPRLEAAPAVHPVRGAPMPPVALNEDDRTDLRFMHDLSGELRPLAALGPRTVTEPGIPRRAAERDVELIGQAWIQLQSRSPDLARRLPVDGRRWRDLRNALAKNLVHPDPHNLWRAVAEDAPRLRASLSGPDRRQRLEPGSPALSRRRSQASRLGGRAIGD